MLKMLLKTLTLSLLVSTSALAAPDLSGYGGQWVGKCSLEGAPGTQPSKWMFDVSQAPKILVASEASPAEEFQLGEIKTITTPEGDSFKFQLAVERNDNLTMKMFAFDGEGRPQQYESNLVFTLAKDGSLEMKMTEWYYSAGQVMTGEVYNCKYAKSP